MSSALVGNENSQVKIESLSSESYKYSLQTLWSLKSVQFIYSVASYCLWPHGWQHAGLSCPSPSPRVCSNSCPLNQWCHPTVSSSVIPFSSCLQSFPASGSFLSPFTLVGQSFGASASASVLPMTIQDWFPLGLTGLISLQSKELSRDLSNTQLKSVNSLALSFLYGTTLTSIYTTTGKAIALTRWTLLCQESNVSAFIICCLGFS